MDFLFWSHIFGVLCVSYINMRLYSLSLGKFSSAILLKIYIISLNLDFPLLSVLKIGRFGCFMVPPFSMCFFPVYTGCGTWVDLRVCGGYVERTIRRTHQFKPWRKKGRIWLDGKVECGPQKRSMAKVGKVII